METKIFFVVSCFILTALLTSCAGAVPVTQQTADNQTAASDDETIEQPVDLRWNAAENEKLQYVVRRCFEYNIKDETGKQKAHAGEEEMFLILSWKQEIGCLQFANLEQIRSINPHSIVMEQGNIAEIGKQTEIFGLFPLPDKPVSIGETCERSGTEGTEDDKIFAKMTVKLVGFEEIKNIKCAKLEMSFQLEVEKKGEHICFTLVRSLNGTHFFDIKQGRFIKGETTGATQVTQKFKNTDTGEWETENENLHIKISTELKK
ncbi:MAG: hypothetical protein ABIH42_07415 [Planctomycetota bacterium]